jgi:hypothetical protein
MHELVSDRPSWDVAEGHEIAPGRTVLKPLGGGHRYSDSDDNRNGDTDTSRGASASSRSRGTDNSKSRV